MMYAIAGSGVMSANYPPESELSRKVRRLIKAAQKKLEGLCTQLKQ